MDYVTAMVMLANDPQQVMYRSADTPVSWPEVLVLQYLHGDEAVYDCKYLRSQPTSIAEEKKRLVSVYGREVIETVYPGRRPQIESVFPGERPGAPKATQEARPADAALRRPVEKKPAPGREVEAEVEI